MSFLIAIRGWLFSIANFFYTLYSETTGWIWPFNKVAGLFHDMGRFIDNIIWEVYQFDTWLQGIVSQLSSFLTWANLTNWFSQFLNIITSAWNWVVNWWSNVTNAISSWWQGIAPTVQSWITSATQGLSDLKTKWDNFWTTILPNLINWQNLSSWWVSKLTDIGNLIDSAFQARSRFWEGWQDVRDNVVKFISSPLDWLENKFTDWFLGKE